MADWVPSGEQAKLEAFTVFSRGLAERPDVYGVSAADVAEAVRLVDALRDAMAAISNPVTRTMRDTAVKNECLDAASPFLRRLAASRRGGPKRLGKS